jgi:hypothetical protein
VDALRWRSRTCKSTVSLTLTHFINLAHEIVIFDRLHEFKKAEAESHHTSQSVFTLHCLCSAKCSFHHISVMFDPALPFKTCHGILQDDAISEPFMHIVSHGTWSPLFVFWALPLCFYVILSGTQNIPHVVLAYSTAIVGLSYVSYDHLKLLIVTYDVSPPPPTHTHTHTHTDVDVTMYIRVCSNFSKQTLISASIA